MKRLDREWMYERLDSDTKKLRLEFVKGVQEFIIYAKQQPEYKSSKQIRCPCEKCQNKVYLVVQEVQKHLSLKGYCDGYYDWVCHGENFPVEERIVEERIVSDNPYRDMVEDSLRDNIDQIREEALNAEVVDESPNPLVRAFFEMLKHGEQPVYEGTKFTLLQSAARLINLKCEWNLAHKCIDSFTSYIRDIIPEKGVMTRNLYETKKVPKALQLPCDKIDVCCFGCMIFWEDDADLDKCKKCGEDRYKCKTTQNGKSVSKKVLTYFPLGPRLQRIYATKHIAGQMRWHYENPRVSGIMSHPSDGEAWKHFDHQHPQFSSEPRNVRHRLCTEGFQPFGQFGTKYSCWPVMVTPYNLPPWLCMKRQFIFLSLMIPGPKNPKQNLDIYLQPLLKELKELWSTRLFTYDVSRKQNFILRASLLWTINDFPAYGMLSGWTTAG
ncbi:uncharacterized protein LOC141631622 [Silene latifolia]|uniref:uncharacterized protein LOC141631622 n=1 Tax=Silene latifolia TaxID=37657 RepID=UPI003D77267C